MIRSSWLQYVHCYSTCFNGIQTFGLYNTGMVFRETELLYEATIECRFLFDNPAGENFNKILIKGFVEVLTRSYKILSQKSYKILTRSFKILNKILIRFLLRFL